MNNLAVANIDSWTLASKLNTRSEFDNDSVDATAKSSVGSQSVFQQLHARHDSFLHPVWAITISGELRSLEKPLVLRVQNEGSRYFAENDLLDICGYGDSPKDAVNDALEDLVYYYSYYSALADNEVIGYGALLKKKFEKLLGK